MNDDLTHAVDALVIATAEFNRADKRFRDCEATRARLLTDLDKFERAKLDAEEALVQAVSEHPFKPGGPIPGPRMTFAHAGEEVET